MKIDTSDITMTGSRHYTETNQEQTQVNFNFFEIFDRKMARKENQDHISAENAGFQPFSQIPAMGMGHGGCWCKPLTIGEQNAIQLSDQLIHELDKMRDMMDAIFEQINSLGSNSSASFFHFQQRRISRVNINPSNMGFTRTFGYEYTEKHTYQHYEKENTDFTADGKVKTVDGKEIDFSFQMNLEREFFREDQFMYTEKGGYKLVDPLIINLDDTAPKLSGATFDFDLDLDGETEELNSLMPGSGFLALDRNGDGVINDGSELFGPSTGDGFAELATYDLDHNLWIDENDAIFDDLSIWENDEEGEINLTRIKDAGIGAIYLANVETPFDLRDENNLLQGRVTKSGIALTEDGQVKSVQEVDWAV